MYHILQGCTYKSININIFEKVEDNSGHMKTILGI